MQLHQRPGTSLGSRQPRSITRSSRLRVVCSIRARWSIDCRYGCKTEATLLLQEWVRDIGSVAGLNAANTRLASGAVGVPESRLELEVTFNNLSEWENFLGRIPFKDHKAWSQRIQSMVTNDDSPKWEVFRVVPVEAELPAAASSSTAASTAASSNSQQQLQLSSSGLLLPSQQEVPPSASAASVPETVSAGGLTIIESSAAADVILDWKGEPMKLNPGDKMPFKFL